ncbi:MAG: hypothetical protein MR009_01620 [Sutterellaceae bacterium]|nr:hypothetical protein [Sutterellaceae bacterium]MDD7442204.1 hypothetical protein [Sutterellaceae bacterium]MDY2868199.1 hypothetical protein [Mesosutterella sp.]
MSLKKQAAAAILAATIAMPAAHAEGFFSGALSAINSTTPAGLMDEPERTPGVEGWFRDTGSGFSRILREGSTAIVLPLYTEHPRWDYDNRSQENAYPFGSGIARIMVDSRGNERLAYAIAFSDSHYKPEPFLGYGWLARWNLGSSGLHVGAGYLAGLTFRADYMWLPIPAPLPLVNVGTENIGAYMTYIPFSNVAFFFTTIRLDDRSSREMPLQPGSVWYGRNNLVYGGGSWVHNDLGDPDHERGRMTMTSDAGWNAGIRHYFDRHWAADLKVVRSKHDTRWNGAKRFDWDMTQVSLVGQYHADMTKSFRLFAGAGIGYARLHRDGKSENSIHPALETGFTWAFSREFHLTGSILTAFPRFSHIDPEMADGTGRPAPASFNLSLGKTF